MATLTAAQSLGVQRDFGSIAPGKVASIAAVADLHGFDVKVMLSEGRISARDGSYLLTPEITRYPEEWYDTVHVASALEASDFLFDPELSEAEVRVIGITPGSLLTDELIETVRFTEGRVLEPEDLATIAVIDRHFASYDRGIGLVRGFDIETERDRNHDQPGRGSWGSRSRGMQAKGSDPIPAWFFCCGLQVGHEPLAASIPAISALPTCHGGSLPYNPDSRITAEQDRRTRPNSGCVRTSPTSATRGGLRI